MVENSNLSVLAVRRGGEGPLGLADAIEYGHELDELSPMEVFRLKYRSDHDSDPPTDLEGAFIELLTEVLSGEESEPSKTGEGGGDG